MKISIGELRRIIQNVIIEGAGGTTLPRMPMIRNSMGPDFADREQLSRIASKQAKDEDEISPHLLNPLNPEEECWGPVPPTGEDPYALPDPYTKDTGVLPTPPIKR